jgi:hypothetical protein
MSPNNWVGAGVAIGTCLLSVFTIVLLFSWDQPHTRRDRYRDILRGILGG